MMLVVVAAALFKKCDMEKKFAECSTVRGMEQCGNFTSQFLPLF